MKILNALMIVALAAGTFSCKKGENDPFLSLKTRDSRIAGTWVLKSAEANSTEILTFDGTTETETTTQKFDGTVVTVVSPDGTGTYSMSQEITIEKDGSFMTKTVEDGDISESTGSWWWLDDKKRKTRIAFDDDASSFEIDRLTGKELVLKVDYTSKYTSGSAVSTYTYTETQTYEKKK